ncbi:MAG: GerMN domain-containing protein [Bacilli bacterium]|nr:GerMN domain-containing protein [Bacilli bacterium]
MKKIFPLVLLLFVLVSIATLPTISNKNTLRTNYEIKEESIPNTKLYLKNKYNYLVKVNVLLPLKDQVESIVEYLREDNNDLDIEWSGYIPKGTKILESKIKDKVLEIHFSKELEKMDKKYLIGIKESLLEIKRVEDVIIYIEDELVDDYLPLNKVEEWSNRDKIEKVVIYYVNSLSSPYLVPVTKYLNIDNNKIDIILEELKNNIPDHLISLVNNNVKLNSFKLENDILTLDFDNSILSDKKHKDLIVEEIAYSVLDNFDCSSVVIKVNNNFQKIVNKKR